ncbi:hypothetical protein Daus18300_003382 [Diaporthe australafricana]|uniref:Kinetochore protein n=1 Tax=Diaporthe australafricana TaxID=127596 RepID=A0ABR3XGI5_9PEZI
MAPPAPTILTLKQNFLTTQTRLLSQPLQPSRAWRRANEAAANDDSDAVAVSERAVDDALFRLNHTLQQHSKRVYVPQATRQIAEQIDKLYLSAGERAAAADDDDDDGDNALGDADAWRNVGADYADAGVVSSLPPAWESGREAAAYPLEAERYAELAGRLRGLLARREEARARVERLRRMNALLAPFGSPAAGAGEASSRDPPGSGVQENLVTRDGEVEKELERMRVLLVRVGDKVARLREKEVGRDDDSDLFGDGEAMIVDDAEVDERRKVEGLLDGLV